MKLRTATRTQKGQVFSPLKKIRKPEVMNLTQNLKSNNKSVLLTNKMTMAKKESNDTNNYKSDNKSHKKSRPFKPKNTPAKSKIKRQRVAIRKTNLLKRRPSFGYKNKLGVCRIINCKRSPSHKCCQKTAETTTERSITTTGKVNKEDQTDITTEISKTTYGIVIKENL